MKSCEEYVEQGKEMEHLLERHNILVEDYKNGNHNVIQEIMDIIIRYKKIDQGRNKTNLHENYSHDFEAVIYYEYDGRGHIGQQCRICNHRIWEMRLLE